MKESERMKGRSTMKCKSVCQLGLAVTVHLVHGFVSLPAPCENHSRKKLSASIVWAATHWKWLVHMSELDEGAASQQWRESSALTRSVRAPPAIPLRERGLISSPGGPNPWLAVLARLCQPQLPQHTVCWRLKKKKNGRPQRWPPEGMGCLARLNAVIGLFWLSGGKKRWEGDRKPTKIWRQGKKKRHLKMTANLMLWRFWSMQGFSSEISLLAF